MTHKHFQSLARALSHARPAPGPQYDQWRLDVDMVATACIEHNFRFNRAQFIEACEQNPEKVNQE